MRTLRLTSVGLVLILSLRPSDAAAQGQAASAKTWVGRHQEIEEYLKAAKVVEIAEIGIGVTNPMQATLAPGGPVASISWKPRTRGKAIRLRSLPTSSTSCWGSIWSR